MISRNALLIIVGLILIAGVFSGLWHERLPEVVPTHWNADGDADAFGPRWKLTVLMPGLMVLLVLLLHFLPLLGPFRSNIESFRPTFNRIAILAMAFFTAIHILILLNAEGRNVPMERAIPILLGVLLAGIGNWFGKLRRNFYVGIRTPWTIANDEVWERTHRLGGRLFVLHGILLVISGLLFPGRALYYLLGATVLIAVFLAVYSLVVYRQVGSRDQLG